MVEFFLHHGVFFKKVQGFEITMMEEFFELSTVEIFYSLEWLFCPRSSFSKSRERLHAKEAGKINCRPLL